MSNKKVYLAKHPLASGTDSEFVRSHLSRIPGISIVECGMGIEPHECASLVIIPDASYDPENDGIITVTRTLFNMVTGFLEEGTGDEIYIFTRRGDSDSSDLERETPMCVTLDDYECEDEDSYDHFGIIYVGDIDDECKLLEAISVDINVHYHDFHSVPRHHKPAPQYAIPPIPSIEDRRLKQYSAEVREANERDWQNILSTSSVRRKLLRRRR